MERRSSDWDRDRDGMPDAWEKANSLNPENPNDSNGDRDSNSYTNLEEYVNSLHGLSVYLSLYLLPECQGI